MESLEELKKKYEELGKEIKRLEKEKEKENKRWRAIDGQNYYCITYGGNIIQDEEKNAKEDIFRYKTRNYFLTKEEAEEYMEKLETYYDLLDLAEELNNGKKIDWNNLNQVKYKIAYDYTLEALLPEENVFLKEMGQIYCLNKEFASIALERIGKDKIEKLFKEDI